MLRTRGVALRLLLGIVMLQVLGCASTEPRVDPRAAARMLQEGKLEEALAEYERLVKLAPERADLYVGLGRAHFALADRALRDKEEERYTAELEKSQGHILRALELDPGSAEAHTILGIISAYRQDLKAAAQSFRIARRLDPLQPIHYLNLAEISIYQGRLTQARRYLAQGRKLGAPPVLVERNEVLAAWRDGDYVEAEDIFDDILELNPGVARLIVQEWGGEGDVRSFEDMAEACCGSTACGPFMKRPCREMKQQIAERELQEETLRREVQLEIERAERMRGVLRDRRDLQIEVDEETAEAAEQAEEKAQEEGAQRDRQPRR
jgi:Flp pilus assembly protein TadD